MWRQTLSNGCNKVGKIKGWEPLIWYLVRNPIVILRRSSVLVWGWHHFASTVEDWDRLDPVSRLEVMRERMSSACQRRFGLTELGRDLIAAARMRPALRRP